MSLSSLSIDLPVNPIVPIQVYTLHESIALEALRLSKSIEVLHEAAALLILFPSASWSHVLSFVSHF